MPSLAFSGGVARRRDALLYTAAAVLGSCIWLGLLGGALTLVLSRRYWPGVRQVVSWERGQVGWVRLHQRMVCWRARGIAGLWAGPQIVYRDELSPAEYARLRRALKAAVAPVRAQR